MNSDPVLASYEAFAPVYNDFNHANDYEKWLGLALLPELQKHGLEDSGSALDVGCGTGRAFPPLLRRGWRVHGCDLSPAMLEIASREGGPDVILQVADMRDLPHIGDFDLVLALNAPVNYLLDAGDLVRALSAMQGNLARNGLLAFDVNSASTYAAGYFGELAVEHEGSRWIWKGCGEVTPSIFEAELTGDRLDLPIRHLERFRATHEVLEAMEEAGLETLAALGMSESEGRILLSDPPDEQRNYKIVFIGRSCR
jgi:SAM-dependent methyltransferase